MQNGRMEGREGAVEIQPQNVRPSIFLCKYPSQRAVNSVSVLPPPKFGPPLPPAAGQKQKSQEFGHLETDGTKGVLVVTKGG